MTSTDEMDPSPKFHVTHVQGEMEHAVEIIIQEGPIDGTVDVPDETDRTAETRRLTHRDPSEVIRVIVSQSEGSSVDSNPEQSHADGIVDADQVSIPIQIATDTSSASDNLFKVALSQRFGYVYTLDQAELVRRKYEVQTNTSYVAVSNIKLNFGQTEFSHRNHRIYWEEPRQDTSCKSASKIKFDGVPFILLSKKVLDCQHGRDWHRRSKEKEKEKEERKRRKKQPRIRETRKLGCLANITMRELICFPEFKIDENSEYWRKLASKKLRTALKEGEVKGQKRIYIDLPEALSHNHSIDQNAQITHQTLDERVLKKLQELVGDGVLDVDEMRLLLQNYVNKEIFFGQPSLPSTNRHFYPSKFTIRAYIRRCCGQQKHTEKEPDQGIEASQAQAELIGKQFCTQYYSIFDRDRKMVEPFYHDCSVMTFEGYRHVGKTSIMTKLMNLPFTSVLHAVTSVDCHCTIDNSILIAVLGQLRVDTDPDKTFHQTFMLKQQGESLFIINDIFRLGVHNF